MKQKKFFKQLIWIGVCIVTSTACSLFSDKETTAIDPPQAVTDATPETPAQEEMNVTNEPTQLQTVYVKDEKGFLAPVTIHMPKTASPARAALQSMVTDGPGSKRLPAGFQALLPKGTEVRGLSISPVNKQAIVDFSQSFVNYSAEDERKILEAVTWTLTDFPTIDSVQIRVDGKKLQEMPVAKTPLDEPWSRKMGINLEKVDSISHHQTTPVTLYFLNQNKQNFKYFVPVTRFIQRTDQLAQAVMTQLLAGPHVTSGLQSVLHSTAAVQDIDTSNDLITVDFNEHVLGPDQKVSADALNMIVLSLSENTGVQQIQFKVNGSREVFSYDKASFDKPVTRPKHVNLTER